LLALFKGNDVDQPRNLAKSSMIVMVNFVVRLAVFYSRNKERRRSPSITELSKIEIALLRIFRFGVLKDMKIAVNFS
jgi:hypothetical protein